jgi:hypothetical protein
MTTIQISARDGVREAVLRSTGLTVSRPGPQGGKGSEIVLTWDEWDALVAAVDGARAGVNAPVSAARQIAGPGSAIGPRGEEKR